MIDFILKNFLTIILIGITLALIGIYINLRINKIKRTGIKTVGEIIDYLESKNCNDDSHFKNSYNAVVKFRDLNGNPRSIIHGFGTTYKPKTILPKKVEIRYVEENGKIEIVFLENDNLGFLGSSLLILGLIITVTTTFLYFYKKV